MHSRDSDCDYSDIVSVGHPILCNTPRHTSNHAANERDRMIGRTSDRSTGRPNDRTAYKCVQWLFQQTFPNHLSTKATTATAPLTNTCANAMVSQHM